MDNGARIYVAGLRGLVGSAIVRALKQRGLDDPIAVTPSELDLGDTTAVQRMMDRERPNRVYLDGAKVRGNKAIADAPACFTFDN